MLIYLLGRPHRTRARRAILPDGYPPPKVLRVLAFSGPDEARALTQDPHRRHPFATEVYRRGRNSGISGAPIYRFVGYGMPAPPPSWMARPCARPLPIPSPRSSPDAPIHGRAPAR